MVSQSRKLGAACDRCYELKERCVRISSDSCARCSRLSQPCRTVRPAKPAGRRPRREAAAAKLQLSTASASDTTWLQDADIDTEERELFTFLLSNPEPLECFVLGPSFERDQKQSIAAPLQTAWPVLKDAYLAYAAVLKSLQQAATEKEHNASFRRASYAMATLRRLPVSSSSDAALCLVLGSMLTSFVYASIGTGVWDICHYCLSTTKPFIGESALHPETEPHIAFLVIMETMECFARCQLPTLRIPLQPPGSVNRCLGLCIPLMTYYYDLCVISHSIAQTTDPGAMASLHRQLDDVLASVQEWQPSESEELLYRFQSVEVIHLLAQAKVYRLAAMLMAHRLRHVFGQKDTQASLLSLEIMMELGLAQRMTKKSIRFVTLPFVVAAVEIQGSAARLMAVQDVDRYVDHFTPVVQKAIKVFLSRVWMDRDLHTNHSWYNSIHKPCVILDSFPLPECPV